MKWILAAALALGLTAASGVRAQESKPEIPSITIVATAEEQVRPDQAVLMLGVETERPNRIQAAEENARAASAMIARLKAEGIDPADIKTSSISLDPIVIEERDPKTREIIKRTLTGYKASNYIHARIRSLDRVGAITMNAIRDGGNVYRGLHFVVSDEKGRLDSLRTKAMKEAQYRATLYVTAVSAKLGRLLKIDPSYDPEGNKADLAIPPRVDELTRVAVPIEPGMETLSVRVAVTWELAQD